MQHIRTYTIRYLVQNETCTVTYRLLSCEFCKLKEGFIPNKLLLQCFPFDCRCLAFTMVISVFFTLPSILFLLWFLFACIQVEILLQFSSHTTLCISWLMLDTSSQSACSYITDSPWWHCHVASWLLSKRLWQCTQKTLFFILCSYHITAFLKLVVVNFFFLLLASAASVSYLLFFIYQKGTFYCCNTPADSLLKVLFICCVWLMIYFIAISVETEDYMPRITSRRKKFRYSCTSWVCVQQQFAIFMSLLYCIGSYETQFINCLMVSLHCSEKLISVLCMQCFYILFSEFILKALHRCF
jgi:hypothetical protein